MTVTVTIRNLPDDTRDALTARASRLGQTLQEYVRHLLIEAASRPTVGDVIDGARARVAATGTGVSRSHTIAALGADRR